MPAAYVIGHVTVKDKDKWLKYRKQVPETLAPWGGQLIFRRKLSAVLAGSHQHTDTVLIRFPSLQSINNWYGSAAYQALIPLRELAADIDLLSYEE